MLNRTSCIAMAILMWMMTGIAVYGRHIPGEDNIYDVAFSIIAFISGLTGSFLMVAGLLDNRRVPKPATPVECWPNTNIPVTMEWAISSEASDKVDRYVRECRKRIMDDAECRVIKDGTRRITLQVIEEVINSYE